MAESLLPELIFQGNCPDCGQRKVSLPAVLPEVGDDFNWLARDYDTIRVFMLEELAARFPDRARWTPADMEVVIIDVLAAALDQLSDMADRVYGEAYLGSARRPESVRRLLNFIGYDAVRMARLKDEPEMKPDRLTAEQQLDRLWSSNSAQMEGARRAGPLAVHNQHRMVTVQDYTLRLEEHPIVMRAAARSEWSGSWMTIYVAVILPWTNVKLDDAIVFDEQFQERVASFHEQRGIAVPDWGIDNNSAESGESGISNKPTNRMVLRPYLDAYRMAGQEVILQDAVPIGIILHFSINVASNYFQSEVKRAVEIALSSKPGGFFEPGRLRFGEDLHASDFFQVLMNLDGVENICLNRFKRVGKQNEDPSNVDTITLDGLEIAVCDNNPEHPERGYYHLVLLGGRKG